jgi:hypothetical protein
MLLSWKNYTLHSTKVTGEEKAAKEEIQRIKWRPLYFAVAAFLFFLLGAIVNNLPE